MSKSPGLIFVDAHRPSLTSGQYDVEIRQSLVDSGSKGKNLPELSRTARFHVLGPRIALQPAWIESRFPPASSVGDHADVLPHVVLNRSTLPWERKPAETGSVGTALPGPWMAVLLFDEAELKGVGDAVLLAESTVDVNAVRSPTSDPAFPGLGDEMGLHDADKLRVVDVRRSLLEQVMPEGGWLPWLAHVRERFICSINDDTNTKIGNILNEANVAELLPQFADKGVHLTGQARIVVVIHGSEWRVSDPTTGRLLFVERKSDTEVEVADEARAIVMSCRLTKPGAHYRAFLVSVEGRFDPASKTFDYQNAPDDGLVRLVVLDKWAFSVDADAGHLEQLLKGLGIKGEPGEVMTSWKNPKSDDRKSLFLTSPTNGKTGDGVPLQQVGFAPLYHRLRNGGRTWSWYRGPFVPQRPAARPEPQLPVHTSDALLVKDNDTGMVYTSYAAAWELGRQLGIANPKVALEIVRWKTERIHALHRVSKNDDAKHLQHLHTAAISHEEISVPPVVLSWLQRLAVLDGIPFGYLVPDPAMLPMESLRVFRVDPQWIRWLLDGGMSAGRLLGSSAADELAQLNLAREAVFNALDPDSGGADLIISGCLVRSEAVAGWPDLVVAGHSGNKVQAADEALPILRKAKLSDNVILVLYRGHANWIDMHPKPEAIHHGLDCDESTVPPTWQTRGKVAVEVNADSRTVKFDQWANASPQQPIEEVALQLIAGVPRVQIKVGW